MNAEQALLNKVENPDFLSVSGSRLYGTARPDSDLDLRGFTLPPFEYLLGNYNFNEKSLEGDHKIFSAKRFIELALEGDPLITELFFVDKLHCSVCTPIAEKIFALKDDIISNKVYSRILGYSCSEWRKAMGVKQVLDKRTRTEDTVVNDIREIFKPDKEKMDEIIKVLYAGREIKTVPSVAGIGGKRKAEVEKYGYCVSSASHAIRLVDQISELMMTGNIVFPRHNADILRDIKPTDCTPEQCRELADIMKEISTIVVDDEDGNFLYEETRIGNRKPTYNYEAS